MDIEHVAVCRPVSKIAVDTTRPRKSQRCVAIPETTRSALPPNGRGTNTSTAAIESSSIVDQVGPLTGKQGGIIPLSTAAAQLGENHRFQRGSLNQVGSQFVVLCSEHGVEDCHTCGGVDDVGSIDLESPSVGDEKWLAKKFEYRR